MQRKIEMDGVDEPVRGAIVGEADGESDVCAHAR
jgi:hypothetical protein